MKKILEAAKGRTIEEIKPMYREDGELWAFELKFKDDTKLNIYMCTNAENYLDIDFMENGKYL